MYYLSPTLIHTTLSLTQTILFIVFLPLSLFYLISYQLILSSSFPLSTHHTYFFPLSLCALLWGMHFFNHRSKKSKSKALALMILDLDFSRQALSRGLSTIVLPMFQMGLF